MSHVTVLFGVVLMWSLAAAAEKKPLRNFNLEITGAKCSSNLPTVQSFQCSYERLAANFYAFQGSFKFNKDLKQQLDVSVRVDLLYTYTKTTLRAMDVRLSVCRLLDSLVDYVILRTLMEEMRRTSNMPAKCPFKANTLYKYQNFSFSPNSLPPYTPDTNFTFALEFWDGNTPIAQQVVWGSVTSRLYAKKLRSKLV